MARGDPIFARFDLSLWWDARLRRLSPVQKWVYMTVCAMVVNDNYKPA